MCAVICRKATVALFCQQDELNEQDKLNELNEQDELNGRVS